MEEHGGPERVSGRRGQSRMGIASFVLAVLAILCIAVAVVLIVTFGGEITGTDPASLTQQDVQQNLERSPSATAALGVAGFGVLLSAIFFLLGLVLGVAGLIQSRRKRLFSWIGTVVNGLAVLLIAGLFLLGTAITPTV